KTIVCQDGYGGASAALKEKPDLIILDLMLPGIDGLEVTKILKRDFKTSDIPVIMLTAKSSETDKIVGLELGADDYMTKPFSIKELIARVRAVLRRKGEKIRGQEDTFFKDGDLDMDFSKILVFVKNKPVKLTSKEFELLKTLIRADGRVLSREHLLEAVWGVDRAADIQTRTIDVHVMTLRKKLKTEGERIVTVKNYGYRFNREPKR
ncbi:MAG: response regulator transcription factor, partial [Elusimicrobia bacterium]|nr:response regulator transcription factor [Elusimicrobiota bacterium]